MSSSTQSAAICEQCGAESPDDATPCQNCGVVAHDTLPPPATAALTNKTNNADPPGPAVPQTQPSTSVSAKTSDLSLLEFLLFFFIAGLVAIIALKTNLATVIFEYASHGSAETSRDAAVATAVSQSTPPQRQPPSAAIPAAITSSGPEDKPQPKPTASSPRDKSAPNQIAQNTPQHAGSARQPRSAESPTAAPPKPRNEYQEVKRFVSEIGEEIDAEQNDYNLELQAVGLNSLLEPWHIDQDKTLSQSRSIIRKAGAIVTKHEAKSATLIRDIKSRIQTLPISDDLKQEVAERFERCLIYARLGELGVLRKQAIGQVGKVVDLLAASKRGVDWKIENSELVFASQSSFLAKFHSSTKELRGNVEKQERIQEEGASMREKWLKEEKRRAEKEK